MNKKIIAVFIAIGALLFIPVIVLADTIVDNPEMVWPTSTEKYGIAVYTIRENGRLYFLVSAPADARAASLFTPATDTYMALQRCGRGELEPPVDMRVMCSLANSVNKRKEFFGVWFSLQSEDLIKSTQIAFCSDVRRWQLSLADWATVEP